MEFKNEKNAECGMINENDNIEKNIAYQLEYIIKISIKSFINFIGGNNYKIHNLSNFNEKKTIKRSK